MNIVWENHTCMPLRPTTEFLPNLQRYKDAGVDVVSLNITFDLMTLESAFDVAEAMRKWVLKNHSNFGLVKSFSDIAENQKNGRLSVVFDIEGLKSIGDRIELIDKFHELGVRWTAPVYNKSNQFGGGCLDEDTGLTQLGKVLIQKLNSVGVVPCCSHVGLKTSLDIMAESNKPVIFSHSNPARLHPHPRNISDEQIKACARTGGVIGINGIGIFLGKNDTRIETFVDHILYVSDLVGVRHVGVSLDYAFDQEEVKVFFENNRDLFPEVEYGSSLDIVPPETFSILGAELKKRGMTKEEVHMVMGNNWARVAQDSWQAESIT